MRMPVYPANEFLARVGFYVLKIRWDVDLIETIEFYELLCKRYLYHPCQLSKIFKEHYDEDGGMWTISDKELYKKILDKQKYYGEVYREVDDD